MMRSLFSGVSGLKVHQTRMDSIGNNIANINTTGFKSSRTTFSDMLSQTQAGAGTPTAQLGGTNPRQVGLGSAVASIDILFNDGAAQSTGKNTDIALTGNALFIVKNGDQSYYTRDGAFEFDAEGNYVLPGTGLFVQGWNAVDGSLNTNAEPENIVVRAGKIMNAAATNRITFNGNLDSGDPLISTISFTDDEGNTITLDPNKSYTLLAGEIESTETINSENWEELIKLVEQGNGLLDTPENGVINIPATTWTSYNLEGPSYMSDDQVASKISSFITSINNNYLRNRHNADDQQVTLSNTSMISKKKLTTDYSAANESSSEVKKAMANAINSLNGVFANLSVIITSDTAIVAQDGSIGTMPTSMVLADVDDPMSLIPDSISVSGYANITSATSLSSAKGTMASIIADLNKTIRSIQLDVPAEDRQIGTLYIDGITSDTENAASILTSVRSIQFTADGSDLLEKLQQFNSLRNPNDTETKLSIVTVSNEGVTDAVVDGYVYNHGFSDAAAIYSFIKAKAFVITNLNSDSNAFDESLYEPFFATLDDCNDTGALANVANVGSYFNNDHNGYNSSTNIIGFCNINSSKYNYLASAIDASATDTLATYLSYYNNARALYNHLQAKAFNSTFDTDGDDLLVVGSEEYNDLLELIPGDATEGENPAANFVTEYKYTAALADYYHARMVQTATEYDSVIVGKNLTVNNFDTGEEEELNDDTLLTHYSGETYHFRTATTASLTLSDGTRQTVTTGTYHVGDSIPITTVITVFDSEGGAHKVPILLEKTAANTWMASLSGAHKAANDPDDPDSLKVLELTEDDGSITTITMRPITIEFEGDGTIGSGSSSGDIQLEYAGANGADTTQATVDFSSLTQFDGNSTAYPSADGNKAGVLTSVAIDTSGVITGTYTNGLRQNEAQVAVAQFTNAGGLTKTGNTFWQESNNSGAPNIKTAPDLGIGITPSALEMSNVDLANEFSEMIITQRGFQANSKIINVGDEMLETLVNMKR